MKRGYGSPLQPRMSFLSRLESKFGRLAIPGLIQIIALLQMLVVIIMAFMVKGGPAAYQQFLELDADRVLHGEVWRLVTHVFIPRNISPIWAVFSTLIMMWIGRTLDEAWGAFRVNLYVFGWMLAVTTAALVFRWPASIGGINPSSSLFLYETLLFAFATMFPNEEISFYFVLPIKMKWVALLTVAGTAFWVLKTPALLVPVLVAHLNYLVAFGPGFVSERARQARVMARRGRFESAKLPQGAFFHQCSVCQRTDIDNPQLDFRVLDNGEEICSECRSKRTVLT